ncbi:hypothetical protein [Leptospira jelokensis]|nr:hypothetical protein [Leptospira jelokensis]
MLETNANDDHLIRMSLTSFQVSGPIVLVAKNRKLPIEAGLVTVCNASQV